MLLCLFLSSANAFSTTSDEEKAVSPTPSISQDDAVENPVDLELTEEQKASDDLHVKVDSTEEGNPSAIEDNVEDAVDETQEDVEKNLR